MYPARSTASPWRWGHRCDPAVCLAGELCPQLWDEDLVGDKYENVTGFNLIKRFDLLKISSIKKVRGLRGPAVLRLGAVPLVQPTRKRLRFARLICTPASPGTPGPALLRGWHEAVLGYRGPPGTRSEEVTLGPPGPKGGKGERGLPGSYGT
ncbi:Collagen alpha-1(XVI) chain, partial [Anas platyrhynchos]